MQFNYSAFPLKTAVSYRHCYCLTELWYDLSYDHDIADTINWLKPWSFQPISAFPFVFCKILGECSLCTWIQVILSEYSRCLSYNFQFQTMQSLPFISAPSIIFFYRIKLEVIIFRCAWTQALLLTDIQVQCFAFALLFLKTNPNLSKRKYPHKWSEVDDAGSFTWDLLMCGFMPDMFVSWYFWL